MLRGMLHTSRTPKIAPSLWVLVALAFLPLAGCGGAGGSSASGDTEDAAESYTVRGRVVGPSQQGQALKSDHEAIPEVMDAMRMDFPLEDPADAGRFPAGSLIEFEYVVDGFDTRIRKIESLPEGPELVLPGLEPAGE